MHFDSLRFPADPKTTVSIGGQTVELKECQTAVWVSLAPRLQFEPEYVQRPLLPAIIDTGYNNALCLREDHLQCAELPQWDFAPKCRKMALANSRTIKTPILEVDLILHSTMPGVAPHRIYLDRFGIDVYPSEPSQIPFGLLINDNVEQNLGPRLPVIGLRAFSYGSVDVHMKCTLGCITVDLFVPDNAG